MRKTLLYASSLLLIACGSDSGNKTLEETKTVVKKGPDLSILDTTVSPQNDFYQYACGKWLKDNPVPETEGRWSAFNEVDERNNKLLKEILTDLSQKAESSEKGSSTQKVGDYYNLAMDTAKLDKEGITPIQSTLDLVNNMQSKDELPTVIAQLHKKGIGAFFSYYVYQDIKNNTQHISYFSQGGLGLPDRDFYFKEDEKSASIRAKYVEHVDKIMDLASLGNDYSNSIMEIETELADASMTRVELRNYEAQYNKMSTGDLAKLSPAFSWDTYFKETGVTIDTIIVSQPLFVERMEKVINAQDLDAWKKYLKWNIINTTASYLNSELVAQNFAFYGTELSGVKKMKPRWKRVLKDINRGMGELLGQEYVKVAFPEEAKAKVNELVDNFLVAYEARIKNLDWMTDATKEQALVKLSTFTKKLGYPDKWKDYSELSIEKDSYIKNYFRIQEFGFNDMINDLGKPIDKTKWGMPPQTVNAYYNPALNEIVFPAAILQPPFMDQEADDAVLYATIGAVIGHEITHGFDDKGSGFDAYGELKNWWTEEDLANFQARATKVVDHYEAFQPMEDVKINGKLTLGENIADFGGLTVSYYAYQKSLEGKERKEIDGLSPEQRFFVAFGQVWKGNYTDEALRQQLLTNPHSPNGYRVLGTLSLMPEFYEAFDVKEGDGMYRADSLRPVIW